MICRMNGLPEQAGDTVNAYIAIPITAREATFWRVKL